MSTFTEEEKYAAEATANAEAALTYPIQASALRKGGRALLKGKPCKLIEITTSKTGKHGHAKCSIRGTDIFTGKGVEDMTPSTHNMEVPVIKRVEYEVVFVSADGFLSMMRLGSGGGAEGMKDDVRLPEGELGEKIQGMCEEGKIVEVVVLKAMGKEIVVDAKEVKED